LRESALNLNKRTRTKIRKNAARLRAITVPKGRYVHVSVDVGFSHTLGYWRTQVGQGRTFKAGRNAAKRAYRKLSKSFRKFLKEYDVTQAGEA
jgi:hypothetical protein